MRAGFYPKLAWSAIRKNRRLYLPYLLTCIGMVMMFYLLESLSALAGAADMFGGNNLRIILNLGKFVIAVFSAIFLFYTNSFLARKRDKEFGLYNILGLGKKSLTLVLAWESLIIAAIALGGGLVLGIAFSKLAELCLMKIVRGTVRFSFTLSGSSILITLLIYLLIFLLLFAKSLLHLKRTDPLSLLHSDRHGEKPPKANWFLALVGVGLLGGAYYLAVTIQSPITALALFFVAVIMVILGTYLLFISGSVTLCRLLQKNKRYYYKKNHFVTISSMTYRMKRNGAGLASICILSTMVLVMIASSASLYFGIEDSIRQAYPMETQYSFLFNTANDPRIDVLREDLQGVFDDHDLYPSRKLDYTYGSVMGKLDGTKILTDADGVNHATANNDTLRQVFFIDAEGYRTTTGIDLPVSANQAFLATQQCEYNQPTLSVGALTLSIAGHAEAIPQILEGGVSLVPAIWVILPDLSPLRPLEISSNEVDESRLLYHWCYSYDMDASEEATIRIYQDQCDEISTISDRFPNMEMSYTTVNRSLQRGDFYTNCGGLFFIGLVLSLAFLFATVLIIYYKQVSEGYEDQSRFEIMQKVGMTKSDIKKSINSQILTVFFAPLIFAGIHFSFSFPLVWKLLQMFYLRNLTLCLLVSAGAFLLFGLLYSIVYKVTARSYFSIVSG